MSDIAIGEPAHEIQIEPHWPVLLTIIVVVSLLTLLSGRVRVFPKILGS
jgi:hypothetical protein